MKKVVLICAAIISASCLFANDESDLQDQSTMVDVDLVDRDIELGALFGLTGTENLVEPKVSGYLDFKAEYDKKIKISIDLETDQTKVQADSVSIRFHLNRSNLSADYRKERFFGDDIVSSEKRILSGKSLIEETLANTGYSERAPGVSFLYKGPKSKSFIEELGFRASYDGTLPVMMNAGCTFRMLNDSSWFGATGTVTGPLDNGYGAVFLYVDTGSFLASAQCGGGSYPSALNFLIINNSLLSSPVWRYADAGFGYRALMGDNSCEFWVLGSLFAPAYTQQSVIDGTLLLGGKMIFVKSLVLRAFGGIDYSKAQNVSNIKPDLRFSCTMKI